MHFKLDGGAEDSNLYNISDLIQMVGNHSISDSSSEDDVDKNPDGWSSDKSLPNDCITSKSGHLSNDAHVPFFGPWLFLFCPWLSLFSPWLSLCCSWMSLF